MKIGDKIKLTEGLRKQKTISEWIVKSINKRLMVLDNKKYLRCLNLADVIDQKEIKIQIQRNGAYEQLLINDSFDLRCI